MKRIYITLALVVAVVVSATYAQNPFTNMPPYRPTEPAPCQCDFAVRDALMSDLSQMWIEAIQDSIIAQTRKGFSTALTKRNGPVAFDAWVVESQAAADHLIAQKAALEALGGGS